jgi:hypothetical protein
LTITRRWPSSFARTSTRYSSARSCFPRTAHSPAGGGASCWSRHRRSGRCRERASGRPNKPILRFHTCEKSCELLKTRTAANRRVSNCAVFSRRYNGAARGIRTPDPIITKEHALNDWHRRTATEANDPAWVIRRCADVVQTRRQRSFSVSPPLGGSQHPKNASRRPTAWLRTQPDANPSPPAISDCQGWGASAAARDQEDIQDMRSSSQCW